MAGNSTWLTIGEVLARLRGAGYTESESTVRRMLDSGELGAEGAAWYRTERGGHRRIAVTAVDRLIARRKAGTASEGIEPS